MNKVAEALRASAVLIETLGAEKCAAEAEVVELREKVAAYETRDRALTIAADIDRKGLGDGRSVEKIAAELVERARQGRDLSVTEEAVKMAASQRGMFSINDDHPGVGGGTDAVTRFENWIISNGHGR